MNFAAPDFIGIQPRERFAPPDLRQRSFAFLNCFSNNFRSIEAWSLTAENVSENLLGAAQEDRPDLRTLDQSENLRNAELRIEQGRYLPEIVLFGSYGVTAQQNGSPDFFADPKLRAFSQQAGLRVTWPLFSGFSIYIWLFLKRCNTCGSICDGWTWF